jgi:hypothetical protein
VTIIRVSKRDRYVAIDKTGLEDKRLSYAARGILGCLLCKPDDWTINSRHLANGAPDSRHAVLAALKELQTTGYLIRERRRGFRGQFTWEQVLHERSTQPSFPLLDIVDNSVGNTRDNPVDKPHHGAPHHGWSDATLTKDTCTETPEPKEIDVLTQRMVASCTGRNIEPEAHLVVSMLRRFIDDKIIDESVGWVISEAEQKPRRPRYYLTMVADRARSRGMLVPELKFEASA